MTLASRIVRVSGLTILLALLLASSSRLLHQPKHVTILGTAASTMQSPDSMMQMPADPHASAPFAETLSTVRREVRSLKTLINHTRTANRMLGERLRTRPPAAPAAGFDEEEAL